MIKIYMGYSQFISNKVKNEGPEVMGFTIIKMMRTVRSDVLKVISTFI